MGFQYFITQQIDCHSGFGYSYFKSQFLTKLKLVSTNWPSFRSDDLFHGLFLCHDHVLYPDLGLDHLQPNCLDFIYSTLTFYQPITIKILLFLYYFTILLSFLKVMVILESVLASSVLKNLAIFFGFVWQPYHQLIQFIVGVGVGVRLEVEVEQFRFFLQLHFLQLMIPFLHQHSTIPCLNELTHFHFIRKMMKPPFQLSLFPDLFLYLVPYPFVLVVFLDLDLFHDLFLFLILILGYFLIFQSIFCQCLNFFIRYIHLVLSGLFKIGLLLALVIKFMGTHFFLILLSFQFFYSNLYHALFPFPSSCLFLQPFQLKNIIIITKRSNSVICIKYQFLHVNFLSAPEIYIYIQIIQQAIQQNQS